MGNEKRSLIENSRLSELTNQHTVYIITCAVEGCPCGGKDDGCGRGFFSLFIQAVYGIDFSKKVKVPYHVDYGNTRYRYTDMQKTDTNFWNHYFNQPIKKIDKNFKPVVNRFIELYPLKIWNRQHFRSINEAVISHLEFTEDLKHHLQLAIERITGKNVLGVHIRRTDHQDEVAPVSLQKYFSIIDKHIDAYDSLFVATDDQNVLNELHSRYGQKISFNNVMRSHDNKPVHLNDAFDGRTTLGFDVFLDCYCLSRCKKVILNHSNVSYAVLLFNPELPYILMERMKSKTKRLKTLLLYHLNQSGIRKW